MAVKQATRVYKMKRFWNTTMKRSLALNPGSTPKQVVSPSSSFPNKNIKVLSERDARKVRQNALNPASSPKSNTPPPPKPVDIKQTKEYQTLYRRWVSTIVALPILLYTSWVLYERTYGSKTQKHLVKESPTARLQSKEHGKEEE
ncbi:hypothetical protein BGW36DRAFT_356862 [Talaromyces proteolyticus]|uniref:Uncharacterized protein n=1 Tax=Talaromyces proteolyticus TaxID=1131652 RepID=A0AAD4KUD7_9EURO|nr:uncharacterized protein BGW36DRAFT_356862 [Talaromyces proteolyticus]KAH8700195.1 hypothetical protein BGW36DRAFT_356862 [Talaromyces proteolyticus]